MNEGVSLRIRGGKTAGIGLVLVGKQRNPCPAIRVYPYILQEISNAVFGLLGICRVFLFQSVPCGFLLGAHPALPLENRQSRLINELMSRSNDYVDVVRVVLALAGGFKAIEHKGSFSLSA